MRAEELTLRDLGEDEVIRQLTSLIRLGDRVIAGVGDDCAVIEPLANDEVQLLKTDAVVEGIHFTKEEKPERVGWKALARAVSDIGAMGGTPDCALITLVAPPSTLFSRVKGIYLGLQRCADRFGISIVGGETSSGQDLLLSITLTGKVKKANWISRSDAKPGDLIFVTGELGNSIHSHHLDFVPRVAQGQWLAQNFQLSAMMDLSDGIAKDLPRLAKASRVAYCLHLEAIPCRSGASIEQALNEGEDYELLFCLGSDQAERLKTAWKSVFPTVTLSEIGKILDIKSVAETTNLDGGWDHYQAQSS